MLKALILVSVLSFLACSAGALECSDRITDIRCPEIRKVVRPGPCPVEFAEILPFVVPTRCSLEKRTWWKPFENQCCPSVLQHGHRCTGGCPSSQTFLVNNGFNSVCKCCRMVDPRCELVLFECSDGCTFRQAIPRVDRCDCSNCPP